MIMLDKLIGVIYLLGYMFTMTISGLVIYILTMMMLMYMSLRGKTDFITEFKSITKWYVDKIKNCLDRLGA